METLRRSIVFEGVTITYQLEYKEVKNLNLRIRKDGQVYVSANPLVPLEEIDSFVLRKGTYILSALEQIRSLTQFKAQEKQYVSGETFYIQGRSLRLIVIQANKNSVSSDGVYIYLRIKDPDDIVAKQRIVNRFLDQQCHAIFEKILTELYPLFQKYSVAMPKLRIRDMDTRWGSCLAKKGIITLNKRLLEAPRSCIEYVVMHELCHFIHPNHSKQFYDFLTMIMPDWKDRKNKLDAHAIYWL